MALIINLSTISFSIKSQISRFAKFTANQTNETTTADKVV